MEATGSDPWMLEMSKVSMRLGGISIPRISCNAPTGSRNTAADPGFGPFQRVCIQLQFGILYSQPDHGGLIAAPGHGDFDFGSPLPGRPFPERLDTFRARRPAESRLAKVGL